MYEIEPYITPFLLWPTKNLAFKVPLQGAYCGILQLSADKEYNLPKMVLCKYQRYILKLFSDQLVHWFFV